MKQATFWIFLLLIIGLVVFVASGSKESRAAYSEFAQCLADNGATFYGTFWCPYCQQQKTSLKNVKEIPYVECSNPDRTTKEECAALNIGVEGGSGYPTWIFEDDNKLIGFQELEVLAEKTGCTLPSDREVEETKG